jgi:serine phosphatase RsbU (regulator of sigma subunit)
MTVPLMTATSGVIGALTLVAGESGVVFTDDDVALAHGGRRPGGGGRRARRLYTSALHASRTLQQSLLPPTLPQPAYAEVAAYYAPADESDVIGGDFYDVWPTASGGLCLVVGDVSGKGVDAAALTGECRWTLRSSLTRTGSPSEALEELNSALLQDDRERFVTVVAAVLEPAEDGVRLSYASAGHPAPLLRRADGSAELLAGEGQIVGVLPGPVARPGSAVLRPG